jgi:hypothetical protein
MFGLVTGVLTLGLQFDQQLVVTQQGKESVLRFQQGLEIRRTKASIVNPRVVEVPGSKLQIATWTERSGKSLKPYYSISLDGTKVDTVEQTSYEINLVHGSFDPATERLDVPNTLQAKPSSDVYFVQFDVQPLEEFRQAIRDAGGEIYYYMSNHAYLVRMNDEAKSSVEALPFVRAVSSYDPAFKTDMTLRSQLLNGTLPASHLYNIQLLDFTEETMNDVVAALTMMGAEVTRAIHANAFLTARLTPAQFRALLDFNEVSFVDKWSPPGQDMNNINEVFGVNYVNGFGNFLGAGLRGAVMDGGFVTNHIAFVANPPVWQTAAASNNHGTACYGVNFGDGAGNATGRGVLPLASGAIATYSAYLNGAGDRNALTAQLLSAGIQACYQTNSWGDSQTTLYTTVSAQMDSILFNNDIVILQSQSNTGNQNSRPQAWAKNIVSVGGISHYDNANFDDDRWTSASFGPAQVGRVKPELSNAYDVTLTTYTTTTTGYANFSGTSNATPVTAGLFGVMYQMYAQGVFNNPAIGGSIFAKRPKASLARALMINTARPYELATNVNTTREKQGWGTASPRNLWDRRGNMFMVNETDVLQNLQSKTYRLFVDAGTPQLRVTMAFLEPSPGAATATPHINNLNLKVTAPNGTIYWGNNGMTATGTAVNWTPAGGAASAVDMIENVFIQNPASGAWTVEVIGANIVTDARVETAGVVDADYALVASGVSYYMPINSYSNSFGSVFGGVLDSLNRSDESRMRVHAPTNVDTADSARYLQISATAPSTGVSQIGAQMELAASAAVASYRLQLFNWTTGQWTSFAPATVPTTDTSIIWSTTTTPSAFISSSTREVRARLNFFETSSATDSIWYVDVDQFRMTFNP